MFWARRMVLNVQRNPQGVDSVCENPNSQGVDLEVGTLEDPNDGNWSTNYKNPWGQYEGRVQMSPRIYVDLP